MEYDGADLFLVAESAIERQARLDQIKSKIDADRYDIPSLEVADAIFAFFSRDLDIAGTANPGDSGAGC